MNIGKAEIGIVLVFTYHVLALLLLTSSSAPFLWYLASPRTIYGISCTVTGIGLVLFIVDRKGFLRRMKGVHSVSVLLMILGLIFLVAGLYAFFVANAIARYYATKIPGGYPLTFEESLSGSLFILWEGLVLTSGTLWFMYGFIIIDHGTDLPPFNQKISLEPPTESPEDLLAKYIEIYPHNPEGVLEWHIHEKMKEGKTREQAVKELQTEQLLSYT